VWELVVVVVVDLVVSAWLYWCVWMSGLFEGGSCGSVDWEMGRWVCEVYL